MTGDVKLLLGGERARARRRARLARVRTAPKPYPAVLGYVDAGPPTRRRRPDPGIPRSSSPGGSDALALLAAAASRWSAERCALIQRSGAPQHPSLALPARSLHLGGVQDWRLLRPTGDIGRADVEPYPLRSDPSRCAREANRLGCCPSPTRSTGRGRARSA